MLGLYWDNGEENGNYCNGLHRGYGVIFGVILGLCYMHAAAMLDLA